MKQNPYDVDTSDIEISYAGLDKGFYCFRVELADAKGIPSIVLQMELSNWAFDNANGRWYMGNQFPYKDHPPVHLSNPGNTDTFVIFDRFTDVLSFERQFKVSGITPSMLV